MKVVEADSAIMHHPGEDNVPLMRSHQELVRYESAEDDAYNTVVETLAEKLSRVLQNPGIDDGKTFTSESRIYRPRRLIGPPPTEGLLLEATSHNNNTHFTSFLQQVSSTADN